MSLGSNISFLRKQKKLTQEQFSERMNVTRQTVSRWESDEVIPELDRLIEMCSLFSCNLDALVRENLAEQSGIYSKIKIRRVAPFRMASYVMITPEPENDVLDYMERWAEKSGLKQMCSEVKIIGWDFPLYPRNKNTGSAFADMRRHACFRRTLKPRVAGCLFRKQRSRLCGYND